MEKTFVLRSAYLVKVKNLNKKHRISERSIKKIAGNILEILGKQRNLTLDIVFLSDPAIRAFNKKYKGSNRATDVLSFDLGPCAQILISSDTALRNSGIFNTTFERELILYIIHGILHLAGYDDRTAGQRSKMSKKENAILEKLCGKIRLCKVLMRQ